MYKRVCVYVFAVRTTADSLLLPNVYTCTCSYRLGPCMIGYTLTNLLSVFTHNMSLWVHLCIECIDGNIFIVLEASPRVIQIVSAT